MKYSQTRIATYLANRKRLLYLAVIAGAVFLISLGVWIEGKVTDSAEQKARMYQTAIQVKDDKQLNYSIDTKQGRVLAEVTVKSADLVKFDEMNKSFAKVYKKKERYTRHERTVCETKYRTETRTRTVYDAEGNPSVETYTEEVPYEECHQETYYTWDQVDSWEKSAKEVEMSGRKYPIDLFSLRLDSVEAKDIITGQTGKYVMEEKKGLFDLGIFETASEGDIRYSYSVLKLPKSGTIFLNVSESVRPVFGNKVELRIEKPQELVENAKNDAQTQSTIFTVFWGLLVVVELFGLGYLVYQYEEV